MKELTIEEKARRYDEALERMKSWVKGEHPECFSEAQKAAEFIFPELKESEDEKMRKHIIEVFKDNFSGEDTNRCIAWLEKQGEQKPIVEPKFKIEKGKWYVCIKDLLDNYANKAFYKGDTYLSTQDGSLIPSNSNVPFEVICAGTYFRDWTIQDAKDGDVLASEDKDKVFIYNGKLDLRGRVWAYCGIYKTYDGLRFTECAIGNYFTYKEPHPATKEQRDLLFKKMKEAGYEFDFEKKELKKIEQKPAWSEEDEKKRSLLIKILEVNHPNAYFKVNMEAMYVGELVDWLKSLRGRYTISNR